MSSPTIHIIQRNILLAGCFLAISYPALAQAGVGGGRAAVFALNGDVITGGADGAWVSRRAGNGLAEAFRVRLGADARDVVRALAVDKEGRIYAAGSVRQAGQEQGFLAVLGADGARIGFRLLPGPAYALALDGAGRPIVAGDDFVNFAEGRNVTPPGPVRGLAVGGDGALWAAGRKAASVENGGYGTDAFVARMGKDAAGWEWELPLGGTGAMEEARALGVGADGAIYVAGVTDSVDLRTRNGQQGRLDGPRDAFVARVDGAGVVWLTYLGGRGMDEATALAVDGRGQVLVAGVTDSPDFPFATGWGGGEDGFLARFDAEGRLLESAYVGGAGADRLTAVGVGRNGQAFVAGTKEGEELFRTAAAEGTWNAGFGQAEKAAGTTASTTALTVSPAGNAVFGVSVTLTAQVTAGATGKVTFYDGTTVLGIGTIAGGSASMVTVRLAAGTRALRAFYSGDATYAVSTSATVSYSVTANSGNGFGLSTNYAAGARPNSVALADFNGDGRQDVAVTNDSSSNVSVLLGNGSGGIVAPTNYAVGSNPSSVAVNDFNGDGKADLAVASLLSDNVSILLGTGAGLFQLAVAYETGPNTNPSSLAVADFNGDGQPDLATGNSLSNDVSVLLGNGIGGFSSAVFYPAGNYPSFLAAGDLNGDGKADLVTANSLGNDVSVLLGNGNGTFQTAVNYTSGNNPGSVTIGDFNGDGKADLAVTNLISNNVSIFLGTGTGTFQTAVNFAVGSNPSAAAVGDFNGDGVSDLAVTNSSGNNVTLLLGTGNGAFQSAGSYPVGSSPSSVAVGDFNGDGRADLAVANYTFNSVSLLIAAVPTTVDVTVTSAPAGLAFSTSGAGCATGSGYTTPRILAWAPGSSCVVTFASPQTGTGNVQYAFSKWEDDAAATAARTIVAPATPRTYTATFVTAPQAPTLASATPATATAATQTFALTGRDGNGFADIARMYFLVNSSATVPAGTCHGYYDRVANAIVLYNDAVTAVSAPLVPGTTGTVQNSQCAINGAASSVISSGTDVVLNLNITRQGAYASGALNLYIWVTDTAGTGTGWVQASTWTVVFGAQMPTLASATPATATSATQTFVLTGRDGDGFADIRRIYFLVNSSTAIPAGTCHGFYDRVTNAIFLYNDALTSVAGLSNPGTQGSIQNSQCVINGAASAVTASGTDVVLSLNITRQGTYASGALNLYAWVVDAAANGTGWVQASTWTLGTPQQAPTLASATPATTTAATQTFVITGRDGNGGTDINRIYFLLNSSTAIPAGTCHGFYDRVANAFFLYNDALTSLSGVAGSGTVQNSQCSISGAASSATVAGTDVVMNLNITRQGAYATGALNLYVWVTDTAGTGTGWVQASTWTLGTLQQQAPTVAAATPATTTAATQTFVITGRDGNGGTDINRIYFLLNTSTAIPAGTCHGFYDRVVNAFFLYNDALTSLSGVAGSGTVQNSQCSISGAASSATVAGTDVVMNLNVTRQGAYANGALNLYIWVTDNAGTGTGWVPVSTWTLGTPQQAPTLASATPATASAAAQTFSLTARDANGFADVNRIFFLVNSSTAIPAGTCHGFYDRALNGIYLYNDALTAVSGPLIPGSSTTIQNGQCVVNGAGTSVSAAGTDVVLQLNLTRQGAYAQGALNLYAWVTDRAGAGTGWVVASAWTILVSQPQAPTLAAASPASTTSASQTFSLTARDLNGFTDVSRIFFLVNSSTAIPTGGCHGFYDRTVNGIFLYNDALTSVSGPVTPGAAITIQNSQCSINGAAASVASSGADVVLNLNLLRQGAYASGTRNLYIWVTDNAGTGTGWVQASTWTLP